MALQFYPLKVKNIRRETKDAVSVSFDVPEHLNNVFHYKPGQYLTLKLNINGVQHRRAYSICSSYLYDEPIAVTVKRAPEGVVSNYINHNLKPGDKIEVFPPLGNFTIELNPVISRQYVFFGGGSGVTPLFSLMKSILRTETTSHITFFYANHSEETMIFYEKLEELKKDYPANLDIVHILSAPSDSWKGMRGHLNSDSIKELIDEFVPDNFKENEYFLCGPQGLMGKIKEVLDEYMIPENKIHKESFTAPLSDEIDKSTPEPVNKSSEVGGESKDKIIKVRLYGEEHTITVAPDETVLIAGIRESLDPPFSCQIGACSTCRAKLVSGKVHMDEREALTDEEIEEGYILTCQSHPLTDDVIVDYDDQ